MDTPAGAPPGLHVNRFPTLLFSVIFALAAAMVLGGTLGYVLKPPTLVPGRTQLLVIHDNLDCNPLADTCRWISRYKAC